MAEPSSAELGYNTVGIGIDKDKSSQQAVKWAVDHLLKGKKVNVALIHVKTHSTQAQDPVPKTGRPPSETELQQLFLPYRGFCARKGYDAHEVVLHDLDVSSALVSYIETNSIGTIVVGASNRNALTRLLKATDVPTNLGKLAPEFCAVYVISKGKVQSVRSSNTSNATSGSVSSRSSAGSNSSRSYRTASSISYSNSSSLANTPRPSNARSGSKSPPIPETPNSHDPYSMNSDDNLSGSNPGSWSSSYASRLQSLFGQSTAQPSHRHTGSGSDDNSRDYYSRDSWRSDDMEQSQWSNEEGRTPPKSTHSPGLTPRTQSPGLTPRTTRSPSPTGREKPPYARPMPMQGSPYQSYNSYESSNGFSSDYSREQSSFESMSSTSSHSGTYGENELDAEIRKLKLELNKGMANYQSISDQAYTAKQQADHFQTRQEAHTTDDIKLAKHAASVVADLEQLRGKVATDLTKMTERLAELETEKRIIVDRRVKSKERRATNGFSMTAHRIYSLEEIEIATNNFSASQQIGEGGYGPVYRAMLQHTPVAIKVLRPDVSQGLEQFQKEIDVLGHIRHPNMVLLVGACPEYGCLVYEYMDYGSLEDRLFCKNNTPPIPWRARFKIAADIATALLFLHQTKPEPMVHRDLKPANILLDANYTSKISDVGLARLVPPTVANEMTQYHMTAAAGTFCYIDPEYQQSGMLGTKSDVYSLGVILLQLITGKPAMALAYHVEEAIEKNEFTKMLDPAIPELPVEESLSLAKLAIQCCELRKKDRPDLGSIVLPELIRLRDFAMNS